VVDANDVLVGDLAREQQLLLEALLGVRRRGVTAIGSNHLQRNGDVQLGVPRLVDRAHAADTEHLDDVIARTERLSGAQRADRFSRRWRCVPRGELADRIAAAQAGRGAEAGAWRQSGGVDRNDVGRNRDLRERGAARDAAAGGDSCRAAALGTRHGKLLMSRQLSPRRVPPTRANSTSTPRKYASVPQATRRK